MGTAIHTFLPGAAALPVTNGARYVEVPGTTTPQRYLAFAQASAVMEAYWDLTAKDYGSGNLTLELEWFADSASSGSLVWGAAIGCYTLDTDITDWTAKAVSTENIVIATHLGTGSGANAKRGQRASITITNLDSIAANDAVQLRVRRVGTNGSDNMSGDGNLRKCVLSYSDT